MAVARRAVATMAKIFMLFEVGRDGGGFFFDFYVWKGQSGIAGMFKNVV